ncbi:MAG: excinuclease ABC subunit UvrC [Fibrobacterales bacterium]|nr:excinuclease ABC subunit UvrC [Fibrobacterales bacterium]
MRPVPPLVAEKLAQLPESPGVYLMKDDRGKIIYIGKAKILKNRVKSYFAEGPKEHRAAVLLAPVVADIDWIVTNSELSALVLEAQLVRRHMPHYNVDLKDDKHYPYLKVTKEPFPRVVVARRVANDGARYFGPYADVRAMRRTLEVIRRICLVRECNWKLPEKRPDRPCLAAHIGRCGAPCAGRCGEEEYAKGVQEAVDILSGRRAAIVRELKARMERASAERKYEEAARWRDRLFDVQSLSLRQPVDLGDAKSSLDAVALRKSGAVAAIVVMEWREGCLVERRQAELKCPIEQPADELMLDAMVALGPRVGARLVLFEDEESTSPLLAQWLERQTGKRVRLAVPRRGLKRDLVRMAAENAEMLVSQARARWEAASSLPMPVAELQEVLGMAKPPRKIVCFDISHLGGTNTVASMSVTMDGKPLKSEYRKFRVKTVQGIDDFASMREVVGRRARRIIEEGLPWPDLFLIDGGEGQVSLARAALREAGAPEDLALAGLAKENEEIVVPGRAERIVLDRRSPALQMLQRTRDEAHRFAITFQRQSREKSLQIFASIADVPGVGPRTRLELFRKFRTIEALKAAPEEEVAKAVGAARARALREWFASRG